MGRRGPWGAPAAGRVTGGQDSPPRIAAVPPECAAFLLATLRERGVTSQTVAAAVQRRHASGAPLAAGAITAGWTQLQAAEGWYMARLAGASAGGSAEVVAAEVPSGLEAVEVTTVVAADMLGVTDRRVRQLIASGRLPARQVGRSWVIERDAVVALRER